MQPVMFDKDSARRIGETVRTVERLPGGKDNLQRRRSGGLGRAGLWEVTAVQTGPKTVTIKRVDNIDFDLNDPSEKEDIFYDPSNPPNTGDQGLLIRLGNGSLFFFRRGPALNRVFVDEVAYVRSDLPTQTFGHPNIAVCKRINTPSTHYWIAIFKFRNVIPIVDPIPGWGLKLIVFPQYSPTNEGPWESYNPGGGSSYQVQVAPYSIKQDFDISTVTYNSWTAMTKRGMQIFRPFNPRYPSGTTTLRVMDITNGLTLAGTRSGPDALDQMFDGTTYGIALWIQSGTVVNGGYEEAGFTISKIGATPFPVWTNSYIEWGVP